MSGDLHLTSVEAAVSGHTRGQPEERLACRADNANCLMDPALTDRTTRPILGIRHLDQPNRPMTIPGIERPVQAKILSSSLRGTGTRVVRFEAGWGSRLAGAFTAAVEVFILKGDLVVGSVQLGDYEYARIPKSGVVGGFRSERGAIALLMTSGPVRYDTSTGGAAASLIVGRPSETRWESEWDNTAVFVRPLAAGDSSQAWLGSTQLEGNELWHTHPHDEETFVLEGDLEYADRVDDGTVLTTASPGSYFYRPAGTEHTSPAVRGDETVLTFNRSLGPHEIDPGDDEPIRS